MPAQRKIRKQRNTILSNIEILEKVALFLVIGLTVGAWQLKPLSMLPPGPTYASVQLGHLHPGLQ